MYDVYTVALFFALFLWLFSVVSCKMIEKFSAPRQVHSTLKGPLKHVRMKRCRDAASKIEGNVFEQFDRVDHEDWNLFVPCGYTYVERELAQHDQFRDKKNGWVLGIQGADQFAAKNLSWSILEKHYGRLRATTFMPETWITYDPAQMQQFFNQVKPGDLYIMKKNIQQQKGLHLVSDPSEVTNAFSRGYVIVQRVLRDPFLLNGRKINLRVYVLITCYRGKKTLYMYDDGFVYYSKVPYGSGTTRNEVITTGYIQRDVYKNNPLTAKDFLNYLRTNYGPQYAEKYVRNRDYVLSGFMEAAKDAFCTVNSDVMYAQSFGIDVQPNRDLSNVHILEWNKGQSLEIMDVRDGAVKQKMIDDIFRTVGIVRDGQSSGYEEIWNG